ncbi:armadillo-type protein [Obelidium mucronatum]|nr:armadillo-type protein [Obelidium mucronatum]
MNALIKSTNTVDTSLQIIRHPQLLARILETAATPDSEPLRNICPILISRIIEPIASTPTPTKTKQQPHHHQTEESKTAFKNHIMSYLDSTTSKHKSTGLMALTALFQASNEYASAILLTEGVLQEIVDVIEFETVNVQLATVAMLNSACADEACRKLIGATKECTRVLLNFWKSSKSPESLKSAAAGALVKVMFVDKELEKEIFSGDLKLADGFLSALKKKSGEAGHLEKDVIANSVESLAYLSVRGFIKEVIVNDVDVLKALIGFLKTVDEKAVQYGLVTIFVNLTSLRRRLGEEEEQLLKLREVSGEAVVKPDPLDDDKRVETRCTKLVTAGIVGPLCSISSSATVSLAAAISQLFLNLCVDKRHRGKIVQEGGVKALTSLATKLSASSSSSSSSSVLSSSAGPSSSSYLIAAQSLAKIAITTDPSIAFKPISRALDILRPLIHLLSSNDATTLQQFEGLMALTNLASFDDDVRTRIVALHGVKAMEYLQFSENNLVRRAATEALCNMMFDPVVFEGYATNDGGAVDGNASRLRMMIMLCDVEDYETRRAASGALAILSSHPDACRLIVSDARGLDTITGLLFGEEEDANPELLHRAVEVCKNVAAVGGVLAQRLEAAGIVKLLRALTLNPIEEIKMGAIEALQNLQRAGVNVLSKPQKATKSEPKIVELD